ncbi:MAG TPA: M15 family metallopeptidase [Acidimicrobiia bacterium]|nr:M15 family metallopeptidase [Acidimicrobiia bacterium]
MRRVILGVAMVLSVGCSPGDVVVLPTVVTTTEPPTTVPASSTTTLATTTTTAPATTTTTTNPYARPDWLGTRLLPLRPDEFGEVQPTPPELQDRQLETLDLLPPPTDDEFHWTIDEIPPDVLARSSWVPECPVTLDELSYLTMSHYGFDRRFHTGEMIVNASVAEDVVEVFRRLHEARFPVEQMRVITKEEIDAHPTGDWNDTTSFVCRPAVGSSSWSQHAFGTGIDINPFHNPYLKGDLVLPELASAYTDRDDVRIGMIVPGDVATEAFAEIGWGWGGNWSSLKDWMHFSLSGR